MNIVTPYLGSSTYGNRMVIDYIYESLHKDPLWTRDHEKQFAPIIIK